MTVAIETAVRGREFRRATRRLFANPLSAAGIVLVAAFVLLALGAPLLAPQDPLAMDPAGRLAAPDAAHWFGTDDGGRDVFSRVIHGTRASLLTASASS